MNGKRHEFIYTNGELNLPEQFAEVRNKIKTRILFLDAAEKFNNRQCNSAILTQYAEAYSFFHYGEEEVADVLYKIKGAWLSDIALSLLRNKLISIDSAKKIIDNETSLICLIFSIHYMVFEFTNDGDINDIIEWAEKRVQDLLLSNPEIMKKENNGHWEVSFLENFTKMVNVYKSKKDRVNIKDLIKQVMSMKYETRLIYQENTKTYGHENGMAQNSRRLFELLSAT